MQTGAMRDNSKSCLVLIYACVIGVSLAFVSHSGAGCASLRQRQYLQCWASSIAQQPHRSYFAGSPVAYKSNVPKLRRGWKPGRVGNCGHGRSLGMLLGGPDTFLGVGSPELVVILVIGYFVLGPIELFKLAKQAGVLAGQLKDIGLGTATNLGKIVDEQIAQAEKVASGEIPAGWNDQDMEYPQGEEEEFEDVTLDEFGRIVYDNEERQTPVSGGDEKPFWDGWSPAKLGIGSEEGPLKEASKFASQISGAVNKKVMDLDNDDVDGGVQTWPGAEATVATGAGGVAAGWQPPKSIDEPGMSRELANDVPQELSSPLSIDEQFERLDTIAALEEERANTMQRLEAKIEEKIGGIKNELLALVDEDFRDRRTKVERDFAAKSKAKASSAASGDAGSSSDATTNTESRIDVTAAAAGGTRGEQ